MYEKNVLFLILKAHINLCNTCCLDCALLVSPKAKWVKDKTVIMTYLNKHTHAHTYKFWCYECVLNNLKDVSRRASGTSEERHKMDPSSSN